MAKRFITVQAVIDAETEDQAIERFCDRFCDGFLNKQISVTDVPDDWPETKEDYEYTDDYKPPKLQRVVSER
jgi:hypothetical protein